MARKKERKANKEYVLPTSSKLKDSTPRILSCDPGSRNFGIAVVATDGSQVKVAANSILTNPIHDLTKFESQKQVFLREVGGWIDLYKPNALVVERFQTRGLGGPLIEMVSSMNALMSGYFNLKTLLITASTWKNYMQRRFEFDLNELYKEFAIPPHQIDASLIGVYGLEVGLRKELQFEPSEIAVQVEDTSLLPLIQRKSK
jgi:hypothetical protein